MAHGNTPRCRRAPPPLLMIADVTLILPSLMMPHYAIATDFLRAVSPRLFYTLSHIRAVICLAVYAARRRIHHGATMRCTHTPCYADITLAFADYCCFCYARRILRQLSVTLRCYATYCRVDQNAMSLMISSTDYHHDEIARRDTRHAQR